MYEEYKTRTQRRVSATLKVANPNPSPNPTPN